MTSPGFRATDRAWPALARWLVVLMASRTPESLAVLTAVSDTHLDQPQCPAARPYPAEDQSSIAAEDKSCSRMGRASSIRKGWATPFRTRCGRASAWTSWVGSLRSSKRERRGIVLERDLTAPFRIRV